MNKLFHKLFDATVIITLIGAYLYILGMAYYRGYWQYFGIPTTSIPYPDFKEVLISGAVSLWNINLILIFLSLLIIISIILNLNRVKFSSKLGHKKVQISIVFLLTIIFLGYSIYYTDKNSTQRAEKLSKKPRIAHIFFTNKMGEEITVKDKLSLLFFNDDYYIFFTPYKKGLDNMPKIVIIHKDKIERIELE